MEKQKRPKKSVIPPEKMDSQNIEELSEKTGIVIIEIMMVLSGLEIKGVIRQLPGKKYILK